MFSYICGVFSCLWCAQLSMWCLQLSICGVQLSMWCVVFRCLYGVFSCLFGVFNCLCVVFSCLCGHLVSNAGHRWTHHFNLFHGVIQLSVDWVRREAVVVHCGVNVSAGAPAVKQTGNKDSVLVNKESYINLYQAKWGRGVLQVIVKY